MSGAVVEQCKAFVTRIIALLTHQGKSAGDVLEFLVTVNFVSDVIQEYARSRLAASGAACATELATLRQHLNDYETLLTDLVQEKRFARFVTSNRVRKKLEMLNSSLHNESSKLFMRMRNELRNRGNNNATTANNSSNTSNAGPASNARAVATRDQTIVAYLAGLDKEARAMWETSFGVESPMVEWRAFLDVYRRAVNNAPINTSGLKYLLDNSGTNSVSLYKFSEFLKGFGPLQDSPLRVAELVEAPWFHGYLSSQEADSLLFNSAPCTFLVRISKSRLGSFALAYLNEDNGMVHTLITATGDRHGFKIEEEVNAQQQQNHFSSIVDVVQHYATILKYPFQSTLAREAWFHGDLSAQEASEMLAGKSNRTFLFRFSSQPGCLAVSYLQDGAVQHGKVVMRPDGFSFEKETTLYATLQQLVESYNNILTTPILNTPWPTVELGVYSQNGGSRSPTPGSSAVGAVRALPPQRVSADKNGHTPYASINGVSASPSRAQQQQPNGVAAGMARAGMPARAPNRMGAPSSPMLNRVSPVAVVANAPNSEYGSLPTGVTDPNGYGSLPSGVATTNSGYGAVPSGSGANGGGANGEYGLVLSPGGDGNPAYGSIPQSLSSSGLVNVVPPSGAYASVPGQARGTSQGQQYNARSATPVSPYGSVPN